MPTVSSGDVDLHFEERGAGEPPLLLVAGIPAVASDWAALAEPLSATRRVIAYDNRGSGGSTVTPGPYTTRQLAADAIGLLDALGIERADVFGMSLGGMIAQEVALGWPRRVRRLVLGCTHCGVSHAERMPREAGRAFAMTTDDWSERMRALAPFAFAREVDGDALAPTLVLTGDDDQVIPGASSKRRARSDPRRPARGRRGSGHLFFLERPQETLTLLEAFLGR